MLSEKEIVDHAISYKRKGIGQLKLDKNDEMYLWFYSVWDHMEKVLLPQIKEQSENLIEFYPSCFLFWESTPGQQGIADHASRAPNAGTYASGYVCFTDRNIYFVALQAVTQKYPLFKSGPSGLIGTFLELISGKVSEREPHQGDKTWAVDYPSVLAAQITKPEGKGREILSIETASVDWQIHDEPDFLAEMLKIIKMGIDRKFSRM